MPSVPLSLRLADNTNKFMSIQKSNGTRRWSMQEKAVQQAELAGAVPGTIELVEVEETPLAYHPENATRLRVKVVGNMY